jgi:hypothetical protein
MALQPLPNYNFDIPNAGNAFQEGMMWRQQEESRRAQVAEGEAIKKAIADLGTNPSLAALTALAEKYPKLAERFSAPISRLTKEQQQLRMERATPIAYAMKVGNFKVAEELMRQEAEAARNSGDEAGAKKANDMADLIKNSPDVARPTIITSAKFLMDAVSPGSYEATFGKFDTEQKTQAETQKIGAETRGLTADAIVKEAEAKYAPDKIAAELGLTEAQILQAKAAARASNAAARKSDAEATGVNSGLIPPEKRPELELKLRNEYSTQTAQHRDVKSAYNRVLASQATAAGDMALIFNYMKMLDPGSAVREGEFASAANAGSVATAIRNVYNKLVSGERLSESQRKMFTAQANSLYQQSAKGEKVVRDGLTRIATGYGLSPTNIFYEPSESVPAAPPSAAVAAPPAAAVPPRGSPMAPVAVNY